MNSTPRVIIVHGTQGSPEINWFPWLQRELEEIGLESIAPQFPTPEGQCLDSWRKTFRNEVGPIHEQDILVGHSTGVIFLLNVLNELEQSVKGTLLAGGFVSENGNGHYDGLNSTFLATSLDWERVRRNAGRVFVYSGDDDPYVPFRNGVELAECLGVELTVIEGGGHLIGESGFDKFERLLSDLKTI